LSGDIFLKPAGFRGFAVITFFYDVTELDSSFPFAHFLVPKESLK
jgi:hypothetical protein